MGIRRVGNQVAVASLTLAFWMSPVLAQSNQISADKATVSAEMVIRNQFFKTGLSQSVSRGGAASPIGIYSHMSSDAPITSSSRDLEIGTGGRMQFLVSGKGHQ